MATWKEIREQHPATWLVIESLSAQSRDGHRVIDEARVVAISTNGADALSKYRALHRDHPIRELYFVHTTLERLAVEERFWLAFRRSFESESDSSSGGCE